MGGETFLLIDGTFVRAALALEDWRAGLNDPAVPRPYDLSRPRFFDTTHVDRAGTRWVFDDPDSTEWHLAQRMATEFTTGKGYSAARLTGHHTGERVGILCLPPSATTALAIHPDEIARTPFPFTDLTDHWAQIGRAAVAIAANRGLPTGFFTGLLIGSSLIFIGLTPDHVTIFDLADDDPAVVASPWKFTDINTVHWAQAARLATDVCVAREFAGGFFTGHQIPGRRQIAAFH